MKFTTFVASLSITTGMAATTWAADAGKPIARVTNVFGNLKVEPAGAAAQAADIHTLLVNNEKVTTDADGGASLLLASRVVVKIDSNTAVRIIETDGQTLLDLDYGTIHVFIGRRPANAGNVSVVDPNGRVEAPTAVFLASFNPATHESYYACEESTAQLELTGSSSPIAVRTDQQVVVRDAKVITQGPLDRTQFAAHKQSIDRLGVQALRQSSDVFRMRTRTQDMQSAITSLSASGWIDGNRLQVQSANSNSKGSGKTQVSTPAHSGAAAPTPTGTANNTPTTPTVEKPQSIEVVETPAASAAPAPVATPVEAAKPVEVVVTPATPAAPITLDLKPPVDVKPAPIQVTPPVVAVETPTPITPAAPPAITLTNPPPTVVAPAPIALTPPTPTVTTPTVTPVTVTPPPVIAPPVIAITPPTPVALPVVPPPVDIAVKVETPAVTIAPPVTVAPPVVVAPPITITPPPVTPVTITPPVVTPVTVAPPTDVSVPPVTVAPPVVAPPTVTAPVVVTTPVITTPVITTPVVTIPVVTLPPVITPPVTVTVPVVPVPNTTPTDVTK